MRTWIEWITGSVTDWLGGIIKSLVSTQMPYLYLVLMSAALFILLYSVMFIKVKNGRVGWTAFLLSVGVLLLGIGCLVTEEPVLPENEELNGASALVERISPKGLTLDTGDTVVPAGVQFLTRRNKQYREMVRELETVINNKPVTLDKKSIPEGYLICAYDGTDLAEHLLGKGLARAGAGQAAAFTVRGAGIPGRDLEAGMAGQDIQSVHDRVSRVWERLSGIGSVLGLPVMEAGCCFGMAGRQGIDTVV